MCDTNNCNSCVQKDIKTIFSIFLIVTESCNLACRYCFVNQNPRHMSLKTALDAVQFVIKNIEKHNLENPSNILVPNVNFFGGEPLIKWDEIIVPVVDYVRHEYNKPFSLGITTNGTLLTQERIDFLVENNVSILFSIDGAKTTQDYNRPTHSGESSFDKLENVIPIIAKTFPNITFRSTISQEMVDQTFLNFKFALENGFNYVFQMPNTLVCWNKQDKATLIKQLHLIGNYFIEGMRNNTKVGYSPLEEKFKEIKYINEIVDGRIQKQLLKCGFGIRGAVAVGIDGQLMGCQEMPTHTDDTFLVGNIYSGLDEEKVLNLFNRFSQKGIKTERCEACKLEPSCNGGCVANNYLATGDLNTPSEMQCFWDQILLDEAIYIMNVMGEEENNFFKKTYFS